MRDFKFRAWDKRHKKMYRVNSVHFDDPLYGVWCWVDYYDVINQGSYPRQIKSKSLILMQYTGLKDKNGKDVYEGDIVQYLTREMINSHKAWDKGERMSDVEEREPWRIEKSTVRYDYGSFTLDYPLRLHSISSNREIDGEWVRQLTEHTVAGSNYWADTKEQWKDFEIVGNIYENPELLERKDHA